MIIKSNHAIIYGLIWAGLADSQANSFILREKKVKVAIEIKSRVEGMAQTESRSDPRNDNRGMLYRNNGKKVDIGNVKMESYWKSRKRKNVHALRRGGEEFEH